MSQPRVEITFDPATKQYVVSDEDGEFARTSDWPSALPYVEDLLAGPGTLKDGSLKTRTLTTPPPFNQRS